jgi:cytochrome b-561
MAPTEKELSQSWLDQRLGWNRLGGKYARQVFPVHPSFFLGEIALFCFLILISTGILLAFTYEPSTQLVELEGNSVPAAYASVVENDRTALGLLLRQVHHWAAHLMIAAVILHLLRIFFTGIYKNPREVNWLIGLLLLIFSIFASFSGYLLPFDAFSVTATGIGYHIVRSVPWIGPEWADFIFAGKFPSAGVIPRFYAYHAILVPLIMTVLIVLHLAILLKQKHSQPTSARRFTGEGAILGVPLWPQQMLLMTVLFLLVSGTLIFLAGVYPVHPVAYYGPPEPATPVVKPDWYLLWLYGALRLIPSWIDFEWGATTINPENLGGVFLPLLVMALLVILPFVDRSRVPMHFMESPSVHRVRTSVGVGALAFFAVLMVAAYNDELGLSIRMLQGAAVLVPLSTGLFTYLSLRWYGSKAAKPKL